MHNTWRQHDEEGKIQAAFIDTKKQDRIDGSYKDIATI